MSANARAQNKAQLDKWKQEKEKKRLADIAKATEQEEKIHNIVNKKKVDK